MKIELKITDFLAKNKERKFTMNEIAKATQEYYSYVHRTIKKLTTEGVITKEKAGKAQLCSLNVKTEKTAVLIQLGEIEKQTEFYRKNKELKLLLEEFNATLAQPGILSIILFGSYSKGNANKESDIDILVISEKTIALEKQIREIFAKYGKEINAIVMTRKEFEKQKDRPAIKEIINNHHILRGVEHFVGMVLT
jgi:predicted nucleotidyltransferase